MNDQPMWLTFLFAFLIMNVLLVGMAYMTYFERKVLPVCRTVWAPPALVRKGFFSRLPMASSFWARKI